MSPFHTQHDPGDVAGQHAARADCRTTSKPTAWYCPGDRVDVKMPMKCSKITVAVLTGKPYPSRPASCRVVTAGEGFVDKIQYPLIKQRASCRFDGFVQQVLSNVTAKSYVKPHHMSGEGHRKEPSVSRDVNFLPIAHL